MKIEKIGFKKWIKMAHDGKTFAGTPVGVFISWAAESSDFPDFTTWKHMMFFLKELKSNDEGIKAGFLTFQIWKKTHGTDTHMRHLKRG